MSTTQEQREAPRITLPGEIYQRTNQWWWRVRLPGEERTRARRLKSQGTKAARDRETAEKVAFDLWECAVREHATRQIQRESTEKIERLKAQFLDRVRHFTELVEAANARIETETKARAEAEAKLAQTIQAAERKTLNEGQASENRGQGTEEQRLPALQSGPLVPEGPSTPPPTAIEVPYPVAPTAGREPQPPQPATTNITPPAPPATPPVETGVCDCCGAAGIALTCLTPIDSGQSLCPRCLTALRDDLARLDSNA